MLEDQALSSWDLPSGSWVTECWGLGTAYPVLLWVWHEHPLSWPLQALFPSLSVWESGNASGPLKMLLGAEWVLGDLMAGAVEGQSDLASGKPGVLQASSYLGGDGFSTMHVYVSSWGQSMCVHMGLCACMCAGRSVTVWA